MGDLSTEPSMEEILSSIKRIIAEEGDTTPARGRRMPRPIATPRALRDDEDEVLELSDPMPAERDAESEPEPIVARAPERETSPIMPEPQPARASRAAPPEPAPAPEPILSSATAQASRGSLEALSRLLIKPEPASDGTLEGLVRELLRPMLREWLDANLPALVEDLVAREIKRITAVTR